jgi:hypothetical protein
MKLYYNIDTRNDLYIAEIGRPGLTPIEEQKVRQFGEPFIQTGGTFAGMVDRPGYTNTTLTFTGGGGSGATGKLVLNGTGGIQSVTVLTGGTGYASLPAITINGVGIGGLLQAVTLLGVVTGVTVVSAGYGYQQTPASVNFTLPSCLRRLLTDFPVVHVFSLSDTYDADAQAQVWVSTVQAAMQQARDILSTQQAPLEGESLQTV